MARYIPWLGVGEPGSTMAVPAEPRTHYLSAPDGSPMESCLLYQSAAMYVGPTPWLGSVRLRACGAGFCGAASAEIYILLYSSQMGEVGCEEVPPIFSTVVRRRRARRRRRPWGILRVGECDGGETAIDGVSWRWRVGDGKSHTPYMGL